jgi:putative flippase GtrA
MDSSPPIAVTAPRPRARLWTLLGRHQLAAIVCTGVDFGVMGLAVELFDVDPVLATLLGALCGGITNFLLARRWIFEAHEDRAAPQALRYALVSGTSAGLNAFGEYITHTVLGVKYFGARMIVAALVSLFWNFPMQRYFVFRREVRAVEES